MNIHTQENVNENPFNSAEKYANEVCTTELICIDKNNEDEINFFRDDKHAQANSAKKPNKNTKNTVKIKKVSIDINKNVNNSYKNILNKFHKKKQNMTETNMTNENQPDNGYLKTENNLPSSKVYSPNIPNPKKQNSLKYISRKTPITLTYQLYTNIMKYIC